MTTKVTVEPAGHHVLVGVLDHLPDGDQRITHTLLQPAGHYVEGERVPTGQGPWVGWATTSRQVLVRDLDPLDPRVLAANGQLNAPVDHDVRVEEIGHAVEPERREDP